jgi:hypothetical protein
MNFRCVWRAGPLKPKSRYPVHRRQQTRRKARQPFNAFVTQRPRTRAALSGVANRPAMADINNRDERKGWNRHLDGLTGKKLKAVLDTSEDQHGVIRKSGHARRTGTPVIDVSYRFRHR